MFQLLRQGNGPILTPDERYPWEKEGVFNPGVVKVGDEIVMLYRAVGERTAYISHLGLAKSRDGIHFTRTQDTPIYGPQADFDRWATEDPRITPLEGSYYVTYVAVPERIMDNNHGIDRDMPLETATALLKTSDFSSYQNLGIISPSGADDKDTVLFPEKIHGNYAMLHRPTRWSKDWFQTTFAHVVAEEISSYPVEQLPELPGIWYAESEDFVHWHNHKSILQVPKKIGVKIGAGLPPIKTAAGWLLIYHQVEHLQSSNKYIYTARAALLDSVDPTICKAFLPYAILTPQESYEKNADMEIVFPTGGFVEDDTLYVYYGALDSSIGLATGSLSELLAALASCEKPSEPDGDPATML
jgi:predicted GH43/DUF377 family glycosyl hydrolase